MATKYFYGVEYAYGRNVENNGLRPDIVHVFKTKKERDAWVAEGTEIDGVGARDPYPSRKASDDVRVYRINTVVHFEE